MNEMVRPYLFRAYLVAFLVFTFGIALSVIVYFSIIDARDNAIKLVEHKIPVLTTINQLVADFSEQERIVYEYYATQDGGVFWRQFNENKALLDMHALSLSSQELFNDEQLVVQTMQKKIEKLLVRFDGVMSSKTVDWDQLREILIKLTYSRQQLMPLLLAVEESTQQKVDEGHRRTLAKMEWTHLVVIFYGFTIIIFSLIGALYIRKYVLTTAQNTRLALFSQQNPNPIISVDKSGVVIYSNPACFELLACLGLARSQMVQLLPTNFLQLAQKIKDSGESTYSVEQDLKNNILLCNIYWHENIDAFDIHLIDITARKKAEDEVKHLAFYEQETDLPNQYLLNFEVDELITNKQPFTLGFFEISKYSQLVTSLGITTSTSIVKALAKIVAKNLPAEIHLYQLNERQFAFMSETLTSELSLQSLSKKMLLVMEKPITTEYGDFFIELDFGFSFFPEHDNCRDGLFKKTLIALDIASKDEHEHLVIYEDAFSLGMQSNVNLLDSLRVSIEREELFLMFQPQLNLKTNKITGIETLVRWQHKDGLISPADFIPLAEQSGLIVPIGAWILEQASYFAKELVDKGNVDLVVAVNVSPRQFSHPDFFNTVMAILDKSKLPTKNLELEITEGMFMHNEVHTIYLLRKLHQAGIQISIDDFGTGYSSLSYLKRFPVDKLKIDQSFIMDCHNNDEDKAIVRAIVALGKSLSLLTIAEGVEEKAHADFLAAIGCDEIQGYWYSRPLTKDDLLAFIAEKQLEAKRVVSFI